MPLSDLLGVLQQYRGASVSAPPPNVEQDFSQVAQVAPPGPLADGLLALIGKKEGRNH